MADPRLAQLRHLLADYRPTDPRERSHLSSMLDLCARPSDSLSRSHFTPGHFTASAFVLSPRRDRLLLIHHKKLGRWLQPGGHIEPGDLDAATAALREAREETGLPALEPDRDGLFDIDVHTIPAIGGDPAHAHFDLRFLFRSLTEALGRSDEVLGARFFAPHELRALHDADASVLRALDKVWP